MTTHGVAKTLGCLALLLGGASARADLILTQAAIDRGFSLSTFATGFPNLNGRGPIGIEFPDGGGVLVTDRPGNVRLFPTNADGQNAAAVPPTAFYGDSNAFGLARVSGNIYMTQQALGRVVQVNADGTFNQVIVSGLSRATGIHVNPANGHLWVTAFIPGQGSAFLNSLLDVDPIARTATLFQGNLATPDGISTNADGSVVYVALLDGNRLLGFDTATGGVVFDSGLIPGGPDGLALGTGVLAGNIYANLNNGTVVEVNLATGASTVLATGGSRGDFVAVDPTNDTLLLTQSDRIVRLTAPSGGGFQPPTTVPEPGSFALLSLGALGLLSYAWGRRKNVR